MKTKQMRIVVVLGLLPSLLMAGDITTNAVLTTVASALRPILERLDPKPIVEYPEYYPGSICVTFLPQTYKIHPHSMTGEIFTNLVEEVGPSFNGFILSAEVLPRGYVTPLATPQTLHEPYWLTDIDVTPMGQTDKQIYWVLSYGGRMSTKVLDEIRTTLKQLERSPNKTSKPGVAPAPQVQR
jgi:hypothetical protein